VIRRHLIAVLVGATLLWPVVIRVAHAQTAGCQAVTDTASSSAQTEIDYLRTNVRKPQSVQGLTCLAILQSINSLTADAIVGSILDQAFNLIIGQICNALNNYWQAILNQLKCGISVSGIGLGFPNLGGGLICHFNFGGGYGNAIQLNAGIGADGGGYYIPGVANNVAEYGR
jgi:hypothetical protein